MLAVGVAAAVVGAIVVIPTVLAASDDSHTAGPGVTTPPVGNPLVLPPLAHPYTCASSVRIHNEVSIVDGTVPPGAVLARICPINSRGAYWTGPTEPLVTDVKGLISQVNGLPEPPLDLNCTTSLVPIAYALTFQYGDGHTVSVLGSTGGCDGVVMGSQHREGAGVLLRDYLGRLHDQRARFSPSIGSTATLHCFASLPWSKPVLVDGRPPGLIRAVACRYPFSGGLTPTSSGALSPPQVRQLNADLAAHTTRQPTSSPAVRFCEAQRGGVGKLAIAGLNAWGDRVELVGQCSVFRFVDRDGTWYWTPSKQTSAMLASVLRGPARPATGIVGRLLGVGGIAGGVTPFGWPGTVTLRSSGEVYHASAGDDGRFAVAVPPGRYRVTGHSPSYNVGQGQCNPLHPFVTVRSNQAVRVDVLCQMK